MGGAGLRGEAVCEPVGGSIERYLRAPGVRENTGVLHGEGKTGLHLMPT